MKDESQYYIRGVALACLIAALQRRWKTVAQPWIIASMKLCLTDAQIPELARLTRGQRRVVRRGAFEIWRKEHPRARWLVGLPGGVGTFLGYCLGFGLAHLVSFDYRLLVLFSVALIGAGIGGFYGGYRSAVRLRPYFSRFIEEHRDEVG